MSHINPYAATAEVEPKPFATGPQGLVLAGRFQRFIGCLIDGFVQGIVACPSAFGLGIFLAATFNAGLTAQLLTGVVGNILGFLIFLAINAYPLATQGKTVGKLILGLHIVDEKTGQIPPFWPLVLKRYGWQWLALMVPYVGGFILLVDGAMIFRESNKCFHDDTAGTLVVVDQTNF